MTGRRSTASTFDRAQRRHRRSARLRAIPADPRRGAMGIPLGVYLSPVLLALAIIVTDLINLVVPAVGSRRRRLGPARRLIDGDPGTIEAVAWIPVIWVIPGIVLLVVAYLFVAVAAAPDRRRRHRARRWAPARRGPTMPRRSSSPTS